MSAESAWAGMTHPGHSRGLLDVFKRIYLLRLLVRKDMQIRYRGSVLGWIWSYVKPACQFAVYYVAMGMFLGLNHSLPNFPVYLFSGLVLINFFNEAFSNATRSIVDNAPLVKKIYLPRELFPLSSVIIAFVNFLPQVVVLMAACLLVGYDPSWSQLVCIVLAMLILAVLATGVGMLFGALDVGLRDAQNIVEMILLFTMWLSPVFYNMELVSRIAPPWLLTIYNLNPVTAAIGLFHYGVWAPTTAQTPQVMSLIGQHILIYGVIGLFTACIFLVFGQLVFRRLEKNFAQDL